MNNSTESAPRKRQISSTMVVPSDFPPPKFVLGQYVETIDKQDKDVGVLKGRIVGMVYTSRDAALAERSYPGWYYTVETAAFERPTPHHGFLEDELQPLRDRQTDAVSRFLSPK